jgi:hypothetical protein
MSRIFSFRLDPTNPREAEAIIIIQNRLSQGFSTRQTITEALLRINFTNSGATDSEALRNLSQQIKELLDVIGIMGQLNEQKDEVDSTELLSASFISS